LNGGEEGLEFKPADFVAPQAEEETISLADARVSSEAEPLTKRLETERLAAPARIRLPLAWLRSVTTGPLRLQDLENGWKSLELQLPEGNGTVTVRARREEEKVAVAVGFSDPALRSMAAASIDRLRELLQDQYGTKVDFSLMDGGSSDRQQHAPGQPAAKPTASNGSAHGTSVPPPEVKPATTPGRSRHEWVG
jgi:hypothetical protein